MSRRRRPRPHPCPRPRAWAVRALAVTGAAAVFALVPAAAAWAHGGHAPTATNYRTGITGITPDLPGVTVRAVEAGTGLELRNRSGTTVRVLGYDGEPYLEVRPDGAYRNIHSPTTYLNADLTGRAPVPAHADPAAEPAWQRVADAPVARWYDHRAHWMGAGPPPRVAADPGSPHRVLDWAVPLRAGERAGEIRGTLDWVPPPSPWPWWAGAALGAAVVAALGLAARVRLARVAIAVVAVGAGASALGYAVARMIDAGAAGPGEVLAWLATGLLWQVLAGLAAVAAGTYLLVASLRSVRPTETGPVAVAVAGACLAVFAGFAEVAVFARAVAPVPFGAEWARAAVAVALAGGVGVAAAGALALRRLPGARPG